MIISFLNQKGGVGKTTLAVNIAHSLRIIGRKVLLVDSDEQGSARDWHANNEGEILEVVGIDRPTLDKDILKLSKHYDDIIIDGSPRISLMSSRAIVCSDLILIPVTPSPYDVWASQDTIDLIKQRQIIADGLPKAAFIISRKLINTRLAKDVVEILEGFDLPILKNSTSQRVIYATTVAKGNTVLLYDNEAKNEIISIRDEILEDYYAVNEN